MAIHAGILWSCGADLEDHQRRWPTLWRASKLVLRHPCLIQYEVVLSVVVSAWLQNAPELSILTLLSFHCLLHPAKARHLRWCDVQTLDGFLSAWCDQIKYIDQRKVRRMAGHGAQQQVLVECDGIGHTVHSIKSSNLSQLRYNQLGLPLQTDALQRNCRPSPCSRRAALCYFGRTILQKTTTSPYSHRVATESVEEFTSFRTAAASNGALPTPSGLSQQYSLPLSDVGRKTKQRAYRRRTQYECSSTRTDCVVHADGGRALELFFVLWFLYFCFFFFFFFRVFFFVVIFCFRHFLFSWFSSFFYSSCFFFLMIFERNDKCFFFSNLCFGNAWSLFFLR